MFTPQQIEQISFGKATFGGYDMNDVDEFLEPLTEDYITLYKENALLKSKMRVLVGKLEEYRKNEASMKDAMVNAQKTCDKMVAEAEEKCAEMLAAANTAAALRAGESGAWRLEGLVHDPKYPSRPRGGRGGDVAWPKPCWCSAPHRRHYGWWTCLWHCPLPSPLVDLTVA